MAPSMSTPFVGARLTSGASLRLKGMGDASTLSADTEARFEGVATGVGKT